MSRFCGWELEMRMQAWKVTFTADAQSNHHWQPRMLPMMITAGNQQFSSFSKTVPQLTHNASLKTGCKQTFLGSLRFEKDYGPQTLQILTHWCITYGMSCWKSTINSSQSPRWSMSWKSLCRQAAVHRICLVLWLQQRTFRSGSDLPTCRHQPLQIAYHVRQTMLFTSTDWPFNITCIKRSVVVLEKSPCPRGSSRTNLQVLVLVLDYQVRVLVLWLQTPRNFLNTACIFKTIFMWKLSAA